VALSVFGGFWHDPAIADAVVHIQPVQVAALPVLHPAARDALARMPDPRDAELVGPPGIGRRTVAAQFAGASGQVVLAADLPALIAAGATPLQALTRVLRQAAITGSLAYIGDADAATEADWTRARQLGVPYIRGVRHPTGEATAITLAP